MPKGNCGKYEPGIPPREHVAMTPVRQNIQIFVWMTFLFTSLCFATFGADFDTQYILFQWFPSLPRWIRNSCGLSWLLSLLYIFVTKSEPGARTRLIVKNLIIDLILYILAIISKIFKISDSFLFLPLIILFGMVCGSLISFKNTRKQNGNSSNV